MTDVPADSQSTPWQFPAVARAPWSHLQEQSELTLASRQQAAKEIVDRARAEQRTTEDYAGRYPIELLQNAHDACEEEGGRKGTVWFHLTETALLVANEGVPFDETRVEALMRYAASTKSAEKATSRAIGYKGVGFSAVFEVSTNPQIVSDGLAEALSIPVDEGFSCGSGFTS